MGLVHSSVNNSSFRDALIEAGANADFVIRNANTVVSRLQGNLGTLTEDEARVIAGYTVEVPEGQGESMYTVLNTALRGDRSMSSMMRIRDLFMMFLGALRKLPLVEIPVLHRGIDVHIDLTGQTATFSAFTSTSASKNVAREFVGRQGSGTVLTFEHCFGYDISKFSLFPQEQEVLIEPETKFLILSVEPGTITTASCDHIPSMPILQGITSMRHTYDYLCQKWGRR